MLCLNIFTALHNFQYCTFEIKMFEEKLNHFVSICTKTLKNCFKINSSAKIKRKDSIFQKHNVSYINNCFNLSDQAQKKNPYKFWS